MITTTRIALCIAAALASSACSTKPRKFSASVRPTAVNAQQQDRAEIFATCDQLVRMGHKSGFVAAAATGAAGGAGALGGAVAGVGITGSFSTVGSGALVTMPVVGFAAAFGVNRMIRAGRERNYKKTMASCLAEYNYAVVEWTRMKKKQTATATLATSVQLPDAPETASDTEFPPASAQPGNETPAAF